VAILAVVLVVGFYASGKTEEALGEHDPSCVVIDEVAGIMIAFFLLPLNLPVLITAFFLFRAFDMFKIYPANRFESLKGGLGIMADDIVAGLYANILMQIAIRVIHI
jgi:phosphatidylglycerophosphatase A